MQRLYAENQHKGSSILELEAEVSRLKQQAEALTGEYDAVRTEARLQAKQLQSKDEQLSAMPIAAPILNQEQLLIVRDRTLKKFPSIRNRTETKARFRDLLDAFVNELTNNQ